MYLPKYHALTDLEAMQTHIEHHALGAWVCQEDGALVANHIPFILDRTLGPYGRLIGHVSRANPVWRQLGVGMPSVVMFMGAQTYITPSWYPGKRTHGKVVPTWNYVTVHAHGAARAVEDPDWILDMLQRLTESQERSRSNPWSVADAPDDYVRKMLGAIVGIEIVIGRMEGRLKVSQDENHEDRLGTVEGLMQEPDTQAHVMAGLVRKEIEAG
ncbi:FMN-binding negative transcriptional regulator [Hydrogenophaga sp.]|uniref:FMN-binding negative transcriptional regulator n=1 Tax=Hydrogenophaga sp. TaxID=1904254 RepID=UPI002726CA40|nr:FMN-binding negative transcriptional regulator [Hydrogenophaga sp.]MDO8905622.1 FMN-binding negative transcriptional regulator [Hydrogenophaga sp.]